MEGPRTPQPQAAQGSPMEALRPQKAQRSFNPDPPILGDLENPLPADSPSILAKGRSQGNTSSDPQAKIAKITQAKNILGELLDEVDTLGSKAIIMDGISYLDMIIARFQSPAETHDLDMSPADRLVYKMQHDLVKVSTKVDQVLEQTKLSYAEVLKTSSQPQPSPPSPCSPRVVIPLRRDLEQGSYPLGSPSSSPRPRPRSRQEERQTLRDRRLVLKVPLKFLDNLDPMKLRNQINDKFWASGVDKPVVATIGRSVTNLSLVLTTTEDFTGSFLIEKEAIWKGIIPCTSINHDAEWAKLVVHTVPIRPFSIDEGESLMRSEIETFNPRLKLMRNPIWLSREETRVGKYHSSILIHLPSQEMARLALESRVIIAGVSCRVEKFIPKHTQCDRCQRFGHTRTHCINEVRCRVCSLGHEGKDHFCQTCQVRDQECPHSMAKCANCGKGHRADDKKCQEREKFRPRFTRPTRTTSRARSDSMDIDIDQ